MDFAPCVAVAFLASVSNYENEAPAVAESTEVWEEYEAVFTKPKINESHRRQCKGELKS